MHACLLRAGLPRPAGNAAKSGQFIDQFSWDESVPTNIKGLNEIILQMEVLSLKVGCLSSGVGQ